MTTTEETMMRCSLCGDYFQSEYHSQTICGDCSEERRPNMTDHAEMKIPDDVMEAAREAASKYLRNDGLNRASKEFMKGERDNDREIQIAVMAILAERERAAKISQDMSLYRCDIAAKILYVDK